MNIVSIDVDIKILSPLNRILYFVNLGRLVMITRGKSGSLFADANALSNVGGSIPC
jgi:hypothetical protein